MLQHIDISLIKYCFIIVTPCSLKEKKKHYYYNKRNTNRSNRDMFVSFVNCISSLPRVALNSILKSPLYKQRRQIVRFRTLSFGFLTDYWAYFRLSSASPCCTRHVAVARPRPLPPTSRWRAIRACGMRWAKFKLPEVLTLRRTACVPPSTWRPWLAAREGTPLPSTRVANSVPQDSFSTLQVRTLYGSQPTKFRHSFSHSEHRFPAPSSKLCQI